MLCGLKLWSAVNVQNMRADPFQWRFTALSNPMTGTVPKTLYWHMRWYIWALRKGQVFVWGATWGLNTHSQSSTVLTRHEYRVYPQPELWKAPSVHGFSEQLENISCPSNKGKPSKQARRWKLMLYDLKLIMLLRNQETTMTNPWHWRLIL